MDTVITQLVTLLLHAAPDTAVSVGILPRGQQSRNRRKWLIYAGIAAWVFHKTIDDIDLMQRDRILDLPIVLLNQLEQ